MSYKILIAEDDVLIAESLSDCVQELGHEVVGIVSDLSEAKKVLTSKPDICFLDIQMHGKKEGFTIAKVLNDVYKIPFMFITSYSDSNTVKEATKYRPAGYLVKPFDVTDVYTSLEVLIANQFLDLRIEVRDGYDKRIISPLEIKYVKSDNNYVEIYLANSKFVERIALDKFKEKLPSFFKQSHRSYVVNTKMVEKVSTYEIYLTPGDVVPLSRSFRDKWL